MVQRLLLEHRSPDLRPPGLALPLVCPSCDSSSPLQLTTLSWGCHLPRRPLLKGDSSSEPSRFFYLQVFLVDGEAAVPHLLPGLRALVAILSSWHLDFLSLLGIPSSLLRVPSLSGWGREVPRNLCSRAHHCDGEQVGWVCSASSWREEEGRGRIGEAGGGESGASFLSRVGGGQASFVLGLRGFGGQRSLTFVPEA